MPVFRKALIVARQLPMLTATMKPSLGKLETTRVLKMNPTKFFLFGLAPRDLEGSPIYCINFTLLRYLRHRKLGQKMLHRCPAC